MNSIFDQLVNVEQVQRVMESHYRISKMPCALFDPDGKPLIAVAWQKICTNFHRAHPVACARCQESDDYVKAHLLECKDDFLEYHCKNGMIDIAIPILINGEHLATFFTGQFFYEDDLPDRDYFIAQAKFFGFDLDEYLRALDAVPVLNRQFVHDHLLFLHHMVQIVAEMGYANLRSSQEVRDRITVEQEMQEHEQQYRRIIDTANDGVITLDANCRISFINQQMATRLGYTDQEMKGHLASDFILEEDLPIYRQRMNNRQNGLSEHYEIRLRHKDGDAIWSYVSGAPILNDAGQYLGTFAMHKDITKRKRAEESLKLQEREFRTLVENHPDFIVRYDKNLHRMYVNPAWKKASGVDCGEDVCHVSASCGIEEITYMPAEYISVLEECQKNGVRRTVECEWKTPSGKILHTEWVVLPERDLDGNLIGILGIGHDLTEQRKAQHDAFLINFALNNVHEAAFLADDKGRFLFANEEACRLLGYSRCELLKMSVPDIDPYMPVTKWLAHWEEMKVKRSLILESLHKMKCGKTLPVEVHVNYIEYDQHCYLMTLARDISERKHFEEQLRLSESKFRTLAETSPGVLFSAQMKPDGTMCMPYASPRIEEVSGLRPEEIAEDISTLLNRVHPDDRFGLCQSIREATQSKSLWQQEFRIRHSERGIVFIEGRALPGNQEDGESVWYGVMLDITLRKQAEEALKAKQRQLADITVELSLAEERERRRIASVLHDQIGQTLLLSMIKLDTLDATPNPEEREKVLGNVKGLLDQTIHDMRSLTAQLNPPVLSEVGLEAALRWLAHKMLSDYALRIEIDYDNPEPLSEELRSILYQAARELLINVAKHADVGSALLTFRLEGTTFLLTVEDRGKGFDSRERDAIVMKEGSFGLFNLTQRIRYLDGDVSIVSVPGNGACITVMIPLKKNA